MKTKPLPITYYDVAMAHQWPRFRHAIRADLTLLQALDQRGPINTVDSFGSAMLEAARTDVRGLGASLAEQLGVDAESALAMLAQHQPATLESFMATYNFAYHSVLNFELAGRKTFFFRDGLSERLLATEIASDSDIIRLPFKTCQFVFTAPGVVQALGMMGARNGQPLHPRYDAPVSVFATEFDAPEHGGRSLVLLVAQATPTRSHAMLKRQLLIAPGRSLETALRTDWEAVRAQSGVVEETVGRSITDFGAQSDEISDAPFYTDGLLIFRLVLNAILYLSSDRVELVQHSGPAGGPGRRMNHAERRAAARGSRLAYASVGDSVPPIYVSGHRDSSGQPGAAPPSGLYRLQHKLLVRGHWKHQPHGPQRAERKLIWIEPYLRGPDVAETLNKPYIVR